MTLPLPPSAPEFGNALSRLFGRGLLRIVGVRLAGELPDVPKAILLGLPHTSNWDLVLALGMRYALGLRYSWLMKAEAFRGPFGALWRSMGGIPVDRRAATDVVEQVADWFGSQDKAWLGITPEGTRTKVDSYKTGYLRIAETAGVPVFVVGVLPRSGGRHLVFDRLFPLSGDLAADNAAIRDYVESHYSGLKPN